jgi:predicted nicotinamide N-methyase
MQSLPPPQVLQVYLNDHTRITVSDQVFFQTGQDGLHQWESGIVLARFVLFNTDLFRGRRLLELGSGTGLAGITAATVGAEAVLSDYNPDVLENINRSVALSAVQVQVKRIDWTDPRTYMEQQFDFVIGSDLIYHGSPLEALASTIRAHLVPGGKMVLVMPVKRSATTDFLRLMSDFEYEETTLDAEYLASPLRPEELGFKQYPELRLHTFKVHIFTLGA